MIENLRLRNNIIYFVKYLFKREKRNNIEILTDEELEKTKSRFDEEGIEYTIDEIVNDINFLEFEGVKVGSWDEAVQRVNGTYEEPVNHLELIEDAVLEIANILGEVLQNG